ncbi:MAG: hypothetical protein HC887_03335 [Desulfobacteraceae bacterium]|nr:hypothetical protein [Desulfobacteraceae bacterium]
MRKYLGTSLMGLVLIVLITTGCSSQRSLFNPEVSLFGGKRVTLASANQIFGPDFEEFNDQELRKLLDPENKAKALLNGRFSDSSEGERDKYLLRLAFMIANKEYKNNEDDVSHRSQIQDRLIAVSNQRCNLYATYLKRVSSYNNGIFGTLTTMLGGAGGYCYRRRGSANFVWACWYIKWDAR